VIIDDDICSDESKIIACGFCAGFYLGFLRTYPYCNACWSSYTSKSIKVMVLGV
jgi:hypothetical protein